MNLALIGINHRTAILDVREKLWFSDAELPAALAQLKNQFFTECFIVSTCNRTELYGIADVQKNPSSADTIVKSAGESLVNLKSVSHTVLPQHLYRLFGCKAAGHLFKVASGIDSMVIGDIQILNQIKSHYNLATAERTVGVFLNRLVQTALRVGQTCADRNFDKRRRSFCKLRSGRTRQQDILEPVRETSSVGRCGRDRRAGGEKPCRARRCFFFHCQPDPHDEPRSW